MNQEEDGEPWDRTDEKVQAKWGKLTRAERNVFAERWQKRSVKLHELQGIGEDEAKGVLAAVHREQKPFYPTLQDKNGSPEDDRDTPDSLGFPGESPDRHASDFYDWGSD